MRNDLLEPYPDLGKYEGEINLTEVLDRLDEDESAGSVQTIGLYRLYKDISDEDVGGPIDDEHRFAILYENGDGNVAADYYATFEDCQDDWINVLERDVDAELDDWVDDDEGDIEAHHDGY